MINDELKPLRDDFAASKAKIAENRHDNFIIDYGAGAWTANAPEHIVNWEDGWSLVPRASTAPQRRDIINGHSNAMGF